jgi:predicted small secreted protein
MIIRCLLILMAFTLVSCATVYGDGDASATGNINLGDDAIEAAKKKKTEG